MELTFLTGVSRRLALLCCAAFLFIAPVTAQISWTEQTGHGLSGQGYDAADPDDDNDTDLMLAAEGTGAGAMYFVGDGGATWTDATTADIPGWPTFSNIFLRDIDLDDHEEAFFLSKTTEGIHFCKWENNGWLKSYPMSPAMNYSTLDFGYINGDTMPVVFASPPSAEGVDIFKFVPGGGGGGWDRTVGDTSGLSVKWLAVGDFEKDGFHDAMCVDSTGALFLFRYDDPTWIVDRKNLPQDLGITMCWSFDFNKDSYMDLYALDGDGTLLILMNRATDPWELVHSEKSYVYKWLSVMDHDRDGHYDILGTTNDSLFILSGEDVEKWGAPKEAVKVGDGNKFTRSSFEFLDNDVWPDMIAIENEKVVRLFYSQDGAPPAGWADFRPDGWLTYTAPTCSVLVEDNVELSTGTATFEYSTDSGGSWSTTAPVDEVISSDESHALLSTTVAAFDSNGSNYRIRFHIEDAAGNVGHSPEYTVRIDMEPPGLPSLLYTFRHEPNAWGPWSKIDQIRYSWPASEDAHSGIAGYSVVVDQNPDTEPDDVTEFSMGARLQMTEELADATDWYIHLRAVDNAGNISVGTLRDGPFYIDTHRPDPPTFHLDGYVSWPDWANAHTTFSITRGDDGFTDAVGMRYLITHNPTSDPSAGIYYEGVRFSDTTEGYDWTEPWYLHAVTVDRAGNLSDIAHSDPLRVDVFPPGGLIYATPDDDTGSRVRVEVFDIGDRGSGLNYWQLFFREAGMTEWTEYGIYYDHAPEQTVFFTPPDVNTEYQIAAQFHDNVGHSSTMTGWRSTRFERDLGVNIEVEIPHLGDSPTFEARAGAKVYHNDDYVGETNAAGAIRVPDVYIGDRITALYKVYTKESDRRDREELGGSPWAYHVYLTNITIGDDGEMTGHIVSDMGSPMDLVLERRNPLIGFHLVMATDWNPDGIYWEYMRHQIERASDYFYNVSDGQMFLELVELYENRSFWDDGGDGRIHFRNYRANANINGLYSRYSWNNMEFAAITDHRTFIHEMGHYALNLYDEYITHYSDDLWYCDDSNCTLQRLDEESPFAAHGPLSACVMDNQGAAYNFCDDGTGNAHNHETAQERYRNEPCWETIKENLNDFLRPTHYQRWLLTRPEERGGHVPGPDELPCDAWDRVYIFDTPSYYGYGGTFRFLKADSTPWDKRSVLLEHADGSSLSMMATDDYGYTTLHNIWPSDRAVILEVIEGADEPVLHYFDLPDDRYGARTLTESARGAPDRAKKRMLTPDRELALDVSPGTTVTLMLVSLTSSEELSEPPRATIRTEQLDGWVKTIDLEWNAGESAYTAETSLWDADAPSGSVVVETVDWEGEQLDIMSTFHFVPFNDDSAEIHWGASGDPLRIFGTAGAIPSGTVLSITEVTRPAPAGKNVVRGPYRIVSADDSPIAGKTGVMITYSEYVDPLYRVDPSTLGLFKWNETTSSWDALTSHHIEERGEVSAPMTDYGIFVLAGDPDTPAPRGWMFH
ncbi:hypothetical protein KQI84_12260 [bacterium]|nr:hypothetical protein [bacterium]